MTEPLNALQRAVDLLRGGATMLPNVCPACETPLFKIGNVIKCPKCDKQVVIVAGREEESQILRARIIDDTVQTLLNKVREIQVTIQKETDPELIRKLTESLSALLKALETLKHD